jgi:ribosomal protein S10
MSNTKVRIRLKAFEHKNLDNACAKIVETVKRTGGNVCGTNSTTNWSRKDYYFKSCS